MTAKAAHLIGQRFGRLVVLGDSGQRVTRRRDAGEGNGAQVKWRCACDCGGERLALATNLRSGRTTSCGCAWREAVAKRR